MNLTFDSTKIWILIIASLSMLAWKAFYLMILGNPVLVPIAVFLLVGICYSWVNKKKSVLRFIKVWGIFLIVYAIARTVLAFTISLDLGGVEAYIVNQINPLLYVTNLIILASGILIVKKRRLVWGFQREI